MHSGQLFAYFVGVRYKFCINDKEKCYFSFTGPYTEAIYLRFTIFDCFSIWIPAACSRYHLLRIMCWTVFFYRFSPENKGNIQPCTFIPFGFGPRNCIGMRFALLSAKMALVRTLQEFRMEISPETEVWTCTELDYHGQVQSPVQPV